MSTIRLNCAKNWFHKLPSCSVTLLFLTVILHWVSFDKVLAEQVTGVLEDVAYPLQIEHLSNDKKNLESLYQMLKETDLNNHSNIIQLGKAILPLAESLQEDFMLFATLNLMGVSYTYIGKTSESMYSFVRAYKITEGKTGDWRLYRLKVAINLSSFYSKINQTERALFYARENLKLAKELSQVEMYAPIYQSLALFYRETHPDSSLYYSEKAIESFRSDQNKLWEIKSIITYATTLIQEDRLEDAKKELDKAIQGMESIDSKTILKIDLLHPWALLEKKLGNHTKAIALEKERLSLDIEILMPITLESTYKNLAECYESLRLPDSSLHYFKLYLNTKDKISKEDLTQQIQALEVDYAIEQKEKEILQLETTNKKRSQLIALLLLGLSALVVLSIISLYFYIKSKSKALALQILKDKLGIANKILFTEAETRKNFLQLIVHNIRTPMMSAQLNLQNLMNLAVEKEVLEPMEEISDHLGIIEEGISKIIDLESQSAHQSYSQNENFNIQRTIYKTIKEFKTLSKAKFIKINYHKEGEKLLAWADPYLFQYALENLLSNALQYSPPNTLIQISTEATSEKILIRVGDQGRGIPKKELDRLFDDSSAERAKTRNPFYSSWGRGLALTKSFLEETGGLIYLESTSEKGSCFIIEIPRA